MWKYLAFNCLWFSILFLFSFLGVRFLQAVIFIVILAASFFAVFQAGVDPIGWFFYSAFSLVVFWGAARFRRWAYARSVLLDDELEFLSEELKSKQAVQTEKVIETELSRKRADSISLLYEKTKEMSQSLDMLETFVVFGEALSSSSRFRTIKLALFNEEEPRPGHPEALHELHYSDFEGLLDRGLLVKEKRKLKPELFPFDQKMAEIVFESGKSFEGLEGSAGECVAYPIFIHKKIFAILILVDVDKKDAPLLSILVERFASETQRVKLYQKVETLAITDGLTGVYVRRHLVERLEEEVERAKRFGFKLSFLMIDIDYFKHFNDRYGHLVGDVVLKQVAETVKKSVREIDLVGRYGGEEFGVLLIDTDQEGAFFVAERIRRAVADKVFKAYDESLKVTISVGCSSYSEKISDVDLLVDTADSALYQAKRQGRNRVCVSTIAGTP